MKNNINDHKIIVVGEEHYTPLGVIRSLGEEGIAPIAYIKKNSRTKIASCSRYISELHMVDDYNIAVDEIVNKYGDESLKPVIIACDDIVVRSFDKLYDSIKSKFYVNNAGASGRIAHYQDKNVLYELARKCGLNVAKSWKVNCGEIPVDITYPVITKPIESYEGWKQDYYICSNKEELKKAYKKIKGNTLLLQSYIKKKTEMTLEGFSAEQGKKTLFAIKARYTYILPDYYSMAMVVSNATDDKLKNTLEKMISEIGYEGIFEVEFMIDQNEELWFLEINFRNSTWSYASTKVGMNLPYLWSKAMIGELEWKNIEKKVPDNYKAIAEVPDFEQRVRRFKMIGIGKWIREIKAADCLYFYNKDDMKPFISVWLYKGKSIFRKTVNKIIRR